MGNKKLKAVAPVKVKVGWAVSKELDGGGTLTLSGTESSIIEAKQMGEWAERELFPLEAVGEGDPEDRIAPAGVKNPDNGE
jgi:hypothetical protein